MEPGVRRGSAWQVPELAERTWCCKYGGMGLTPRLQNIQDNRWRCCFSGYLLSGVSVRPIRGFTVIYKVSPYPPPPPQ